MRAATGGSMAELEGRVASFRSRQKVILGFVAGSVTTMVAFFIRAFFAEFPPPPGILALA